MQRNLDQLEARCRALESALKAADPSANIDEIIVRTEPVGASASHSGDDDDDGDVADGPFSPKDKPGQTPQASDGMALFADSASRIGFLGKTVILYEIGAPCSC